MPFANIKEEAYFDIFSWEFDQKLREVCNSEAFDKHNLKEFALLRAKEEFMQLHGDWITHGMLAPGALNRLLEQNIKIDLTRNLPQILSEYRAYCNSRAKQNDVRVFTAGECSTVEQEIDKKVFRGGRTKLHMEAAEGTLDNVKNLVEVQRAKTNIKDNSGMTPYQIAFQMGRKEIANYLKNFPM